MNPIQALEQLGENGSFEDVARYWDESAAAAGDEMPDFLMPDNVIEARAWCGIDDGFDAGLLAAAKQISEDPALRGLARHAKWRLFDCEDSHELVDWPTFTRSLGDRHGLFYLLVAFGMVPRIREYHRSLGLPERVTRSTCMQIRCFCDLHQRDHNGLPGIDSRINWLRHYVRAPYLRVGRLEYWLRPDPNPIVYRCRETGGLLALAPDGIALTQDGYRDAQADSEVAWRSTFSDDGTKVTGFPISPLGMAIHRQVTLPASRWQRVMDHDDTFLQIHIPADGKLTLDSVKDSLTEAAAVFGRYFQEEHPVAFVSSSWMFSNVLEDLLPTTSNLVRFLKELYLVPVPSGPTHGLSFVFPDGNYDPKSASRETGLQRAIVDFVTGGGQWRGGGMFFLIEDLEHFGTQHYRSNWPPSEFRGLIEGGRPEHGTGREHPGNAWNKPDRDSA